MIYAASARFADCYRFGGIYQLKQLLDQGLDAKVIDAAADVGGTWYWNRYPGAMSEYAVST